MAERPNLYVSSITFNNGASLSLEKNCVLVFVGQNNVGKSQALRDIYVHSRNESGALVVSKAIFTKSNYAIISGWLATHLTVHDDRDCRSYLGMTCSFNQYQVQRAVDRGVLGDIADAFVSRLDTSTRLSISNPPEAVGRRSAPKHPIHALERDELLHQRVSAYFRKAFGVGLIPFVGYGRTIPLCVGDDPKDVCDETLTGSQRESRFLKVLDGLPQLQDQGDGMRSFAGVMLHLTLGFYNMFLIDEPEAFLHPPQATLLGNVIGELLTNEQQAFISTHSMDFIKGLLEKVPNRVKIIRVTRSGNSNDFSVLDNTRLIQISKDPFLRYSALLEGMFYKNVVLCEGDADCMFYSMLNNAADMKGAKGTETLFTHCGGKQRMPKVIGALKELRVDVKVIPDFDVLNNVVVLKELVQVCGGDWSMIEGDYKILIADVKQRSNVGRTGADVLKEIEAKLADVMETVVSQTTMRNIRASLESNTEWDRLKKTGMNGVGAGNPRSACESILKYLSTIGIHVVPCGELECFVPTVGGHGPNWLHAVIEQCPDTSNTMYDYAKAFIRSWNL